MAIEHLIPAPGCDPRPPRRATATSRSRYAVVKGPGCDPRPPRRATATASSGWCDSEGRSCDPRPPRRATATVPCPRLGLRARMLRSSATSEGDRHIGCLQPGSPSWRVAILGHLGGRPPPPCRPWPPWRQWCCDPRPPRRATATCRLIFEACTCTGCDPRPPRRATATSRPAPSTHATTGCDPRPPRRATATWTREFRQLYPNALRSSATSEGDRHVPFRYARAATPEVAILGHLGGRPPRRSRGRSCGRCSCCDPRPPRRATATAPCSSTSSSYTSCDPRPPRRATATPRPEHQQLARDDVAILGHLGGRPPRAPEEQGEDEHVVAILGHLGGRPPRGRLRPVRPSTVLRSSATSEGDRHPDPGPPPVGHPRCCDPRPPRRATATTSLAQAKREDAKLRSSATSEGDRHGRLLVFVEAVTEVAILGHLGGRPPRRRSASASQRAALRSSATSEGDRHRPRRRRPPARGRGCDPRPPRRATATRGHRQHHRPVGTVAILGHLGGRPPPPETSPPALSPAVAILGHLGGRPPRGTAWSRSSPTGGCDPRPPRRATATGAVRDQHRHRAVAILGHLGGRPPPSAVRLGHPGQYVAILGHLGGRPPHDPYGPPTARRGVAILGHLGGRPPRPSARTCRAVRDALRSSATSEGDRHTPTATAARATARLRSSATSEGDRHRRRPTPDCWSGPLRSSATSEGDRHERVRAVRPDGRRVAILGHLGGRPPPMTASSAPARAVLRSSATSEGDRHPVSSGVGRWCRRRCDPRPPRRATATLTEQCKERSALRIGSLLEVTVLVDSGI